LTPEQCRCLLAGQLTIEITQEELVEDLCWPGRPPGQWLEARARTASRGQRFPAIGRGDADEREQPGRIAETMRA
jgi:hypothetical protein